jgi:hypothetical protein
MSGMKLRDSIRAPVRYGEDEDETQRRASLRHTNDDSFDDSIELGESGQPRPQKRRRTNTVPFNPNLPPAAFPTLDRSQPGRESTSKTSRQKRAVNDNRTDSHASGDLLPPSTDGGMLVDSVVPTGIDGVPLSQLENHIASNNMDNPVYARNVNMAQRTSADIEGTESMETSESDSDDSSPDATQALLDMVSFSSLLCSSIVDHGLMGMILLDPQPGMERSAPGYAS